MSGFTDSHVIPESVGGELSAPLLCKKCNSDMGTLEGILPKDVTMLGHVDQLGDVLPADLVASIYRHAGYFADSDEFGRIYGRWEAPGALTPKESESIRSDRNTLRQMEAELRRHGADDGSIQEKLGEFAAAPAGKAIEVTPGFRVVKGIALDQLEWKRTYGEPIVSRAVPLGIAYLFLALCIGDHIYRVELEPTRILLRNAMAGDKRLEDDWPFVPQGYRNTPPLPRHALWAVQQDEGVLVNVGFFRATIWPVLFPGVELREPEPFYAIDLTTGEETCE